MSGKKVLITLSDAEYFSLKKSSGNIVQQASGFFVMELANPLDRLLKAGYEVTFSSPGGRASTPDPNSESLAAFAGSFYGRQRENDLLERMKPNNDFNSPRRFADISDEECQNFKPTAAICHGPYACLSTKYRPKKGFAHKGYKITSWSDAEEKFMETAVFRGEVEKVASTLRENGADMGEDVMQSAGAITVERELVSGGNAMAAASLGDKFLETLGRSERK
ncbi:ThiJ/PfpI [Botryosphaeria dothidea]|uniref:D-lactate dehydratase n=1 Tax=Botryosphaeria dothidea TaxID=55169 RepID=A0A8H4IJV1_9PEZI|nr:ThiJ/PfpI [Botryosphaeria dothidea]KAF4305979.1 ThiJ/PfpI [Botryosphaeria dothidea]